MSHHHRRRHKAHTYDPDYKNPLKGFLLGAGFAVFALAGIILVVRGFMK